MIVLGIETSCDDTAVAVVGDRPRPHIAANLIHTQLAEHAPYGGVVPEIAARAHLDRIDGLIQRALDEAGVSVPEIDGVAAAAGPGLIGGLIVGTMAAKGIAWAAQKPFIAVNHLEAHALTARLSGFPTPAMPVTFDISGANTGLKLVDADSAGKATLSYLGTFSGSDTVTASVDVNA